MIDRIQNDKNRINVVHLVEWLEIGGGLETAVATMVKGLDHGRYNIRVWCLSAGGTIAQEIENEGIEVRILNLRNYHNPANIIRLARRLRGESIHILHAHGYFPGTFGRLAGIIAGVRVLILHVQTSHQKRSNRHLIMDRLLSRFTGKIIACSESARRYLIDFEGINNKKVVTIHNSVDLRRFENVDKDEVENLRRELCIDISTKVVCTVARLDPIKGLGYLLQAAAIVVSHIRDVKFIFVGEGPLEDELKKETQQLGIAEEVVFTGIRKDIPVLLSASDIFVLSSPEREGLPNVIPEAEACSKPVIATTIGGIPEAVIDGVTGFLVPPKDAKALADKIIFLLQDVSHANKMGQRGRDLCLRQFSVETMIRKLDRLYLNLLGYSSSAAL